MIIFYTPSPSFKPYSGEPEPIEKGRENLTDAAKEARRIYKREWQRANRDKVKAQQERYWERKAAQMMEAQEAQEDKEP